MRYHLIMLVIQLSVFVCFQGIAHAQDGSLTRKEIGRLESKGKISREESIRLTKEIIDREWQDQKRLMEEARARNEEVRKEIRSRSLCLAGTDTALGMLEALYGEFRKDREDVPQYLEYQGGGDDVGIRDLVKGEAEAALVRNPLTKEQIGKLAKAFPGHDFQTLKIPMGSLALVFITNKANPISGLTVDQIEAIYRKETTNWSAVKGSGGTIVPMGTGYPLLSWGMFIRRVFKGNQPQRIPLIPWRVEGYTDAEREAHAAKYKDRWKDTGGKPFHQFNSDREVIDKVAKDKNAIGYCLFPADKPLPRTVRAIPIQFNENSPPVEPTRENILLGRYPMQVSIHWIVSPKASDICKEFIAFVQSAKATASLGSRSLVQAREKQALLQSLRLEDMKAGKGPRVLAIGLRSGHGLMQDLVLDYVKAKAVVQLSYASVDSDVSSIGAFVNGKGASVRELLFLGDKPSMRAMEIHGEKWDSLGRDEDGKPDGTGPEEHVLAGRAVAVIVNPANKLASLSLAQIESIFGGDVKDWSLIGGTGLSSPAGPAGRDGAIPIRCYGLYGRNPAAELFANECLAAAELGRVERLKDTAAVLSAVSMDPRAIAFVDLAAIPASGQSVKVLPIKFGHGEKARNIAPTAENIRSAMYPLSQRYFLYVHPKASDTAKDFATFIATCGASEASPYADTVKAVMETYRKHGLIPLADAAIERMARDVQEARAKAAKKK